MKGNFENLTEGGTYRLKGSEYITTYNPRRRLWELRSPNTNRVAYQIVGNEVVSVRTNRQPGGISVDDVELVRPGDKLGRSLLRENRSMIRIQRKRTKGWTKPDGAIDVTRNGKPVPVGTPNRWGNPYDVRTYGRFPSIVLFRADVERMAPAAREAWLAPLRDTPALMCWCRLDQTCHADVLIEYLERSPA